MLVGGLPVAWLAFTFGIPGTVLGVLAIVAVAVAPFATGDTWPASAAAQADVVLPALALAGMAGVTYGASLLLEAARVALTSRAEALALEVSTTRTILGSVDAAVSVFVPGQPPVHNDRAAGVLRRGGFVVGASGAIGPGDRVWGSDRETPVPGDAQAPVRAQRGEELVAAVQWVGDPDDQAAMVFGAVPITGEDGATRGTLLVGWDATDVLESVRVREEFLGTVSHELRTPLTSILGYLELHDDARRAGEPPEHCQRYLDVVQRNAESLSERIQQLLAVARPGAEQPVAATDVASLVRIKVAEHQRAAGLAGLTLEVTSPESLSAVVNRVAIEQVLDNLVGNAVKYTDSGGVSVVLEPLEPSEPSSLRIRPGGGRRTRGLRAHRLRHRGRHGRHRVPPRLRALLPCRGGRPRRRARHRRRAGDHQAAGGVPPRHHRGAEQPRRGRHLRGDGARARPGARAGPQSSRFLSTLPRWLRGSSSTSTTSRGRLCRDSRSVTRATRSALSDGEGSATT